MNVKIRCEELLPPRLLPDPQQQVSFWSATLQKRIQQQMSGEEEGGMEVCEISESRTLGWQTFQAAVKQCSVLLLVSVWTAFTITGQTALPAVAANGHQRVWGNWHFQRRQVMCIG